jgi:2'-hydroxyisoflavone reductase
MRILVLGGTRFLGRAFVDAARARGHTLTLFNRGRTNPELHAGVERLTGDRDGGLAALAGRTWDAVMDPSGFFPRVVDASARALVGRADRYLFVSSISAYAEPLPRGVDEEAPLARLADPTVEDIGGGNYGGLKALCEERVRDAFADQALVVRPGLIVGPHDTTDRFPYWPRRLARGGEVLAPGSPDAPVQVIDARDLAGWMVSLLERGIAGTFNATGPSQPLTLGRCLETIAAAVGGNARLTWVSDTFLDAGKVEPVDADAALAPRRRPAAGHGEHRAGARRRADVPTARGHGARYARVGALARRRHPRLLAGALGRARTRAARGVGGAQPLDFLRVSVR